MNAIVFADSSITGLANGSLHHESCHSCVTFRQEFDQLWQTLSNREVDFQIWSIHKSFIKELWRLCENLCKTNCARRITWRKTLFKCPTAFWPAKECRVAFTSAYTVHVACDWRQSGIYRKRRFFFMIHSEDARPVSLFQFFINSIGFFRAL